MNLLILSNVGPKPHVKNIKTLHKSSSSLSLLSLISWPPLAGLIQLRQLFLHLQIGLQGSLLLLQEHIFDRQSPLHPHFTNSMMLWGAGNTSDVTAVSRPSSSFHPLSASGSGILGVGVNDLPMRAARLARRTCWRRAPEVGGKFSPSEALVLNNSHRSRLTSKIGVVFS